MPKSNPTQVIVHRLELQSTERNLLSDYLTHQRNTSYIKSVVPAATGVALFVVGSLAVKTVIDIYTALNSIDPIQSFKDLQENMKLQGPKDAVMKIGKKLLAEEIQRRGEAGEPPLTPIEQYCFIWDFIVREIGVVKATIAFPKMAVICMTPTGDTKAWNDLVQASIFKD